MGAEEAGTGVATANAGREVVSVSLFDCCSGSSFVREGTGCVADVCVGLDSSWPAREIATSIGVGEWEERGAGVAGGGAGELLPWLLAIASSQSALSFSIFSWSFLSRRIARSMSSNAG